MQVVAGLTVTKKWAGRRARDVICQAQKAAQEKRTLSFVGARSADGIAGVLTCDKHGVRLGYGGGDGRVLTPARERPSRS